MIEIIGQVVVYGIAVPAAAWVSGCSLYFCYDFSRYCRGLSS